MDTQQPVYRYCVVGTWGQVPTEVARLVDRSGAYLVYPEYRGQFSTQGFIDNGALVGGWDLCYAGQRPREPEHA